MVAFYNQGDQAIYSGGQHFIPQEQYRLGYKPPITGEDQTTTSGAGIPYTGAFTNSGGGTFDTNIRTQQNYKRPDGSYVPGSIGLPGNIPQSGRGREFTGMEADIVGDPRGLQDDEQNWWTRARKGLMGAVTPGLAMLKQGAQWLENKLPVNERAIMENELLGSGFAIDNNGRIVRMEGEYDTAGNIFSDYNAAQMDEDTFDDRIKSLGNMSVEGRRKRIAAIQLAKQQWQEAQGNTDAIIEKKQMDKQMQGYGGPETTSFDETITAAPTHINTGPLHGTGDKGQHSTQGRSTVGGPSGAEGKWKGEDGGRVPFFYGGLAGIL